LRGEAGPNPCGFIVIEEKDDAMEGGKNIIKGNYLTGSYYI
jgi:hypothetical protein